MITRFPILGFLSKAAGTYQSRDGGFELELRKNGYDFLLLTKSRDKRSQIYGVIGVAGTELELHASVGLANIIVLRWPHALDETGENTRIDFKDSTIGLEISISFAKSELLLSTSIANQVKSAYVLQKT